MFIKEAPYYIFKVLNDYKTHLENTGKKELIANNAFLKNVFIDNTTRHGSKLRLPDIQDDSQEEMDY